MFNYLIAPALSHPGVTKSENEMAQKTAIKPQASNEFGSLSGGKSLSILKVSSSTTFWKIAVKVGILILRKHFRKMWSHDHLENKFLEIKKQIAE